MSELDDYIRDLSNIVNNLDEIISRAILKNEGLILQKLKLRLYNTGRDGSGSLIKPAYSDYYIKVKKQNNQITSHVTLRDTGTFYASMFLEYDKRLSSLFVNSYDDKALSLIEKYGEDILGLTKQEQDFIILTVIEPEVNKAIKKINNKDINI